MDENSQELIRIVNEARSNPGIFASRLYQQLKGSYEGDQLNYCGKRIETFEGVTALNDFKDYMDKAKPGAPLKISRALSLAAQDIAIRKGIQGKTDNEVPRVIYESICNNGWTIGKIGELVGLQTHSGAETATYFLLDDGLATRKRRRMLLDPLYRYIGAASSSHKLHGVITIILLAEDVPEDRPHYVPLPLGDDSLMVPQYQQSYGN